MSLVTSIIVTSNGSGYANTNVAISSLICGNAVIPAAGTMRMNMNNTTGRMETWNGLRWIVVSMDFYGDTVKEYIQNVMNDVSEHVTTLAPNNVTINDALSEWIEACERFKVIVALAEHSK